MIKINHHWHTTAPLLDGVDHEFIPALKVDEERGQVSGPVDAVATYYRRGKANIASFHVATTEYPQDSKLILDRGLYRFQNEGVRFILHRWEHAGSALLTDEMGLGKTAQAIVAMREADPDGTKFNLIICPRSVVHTWIVQLKRWGGIRANDIWTPLTREDAAKSLPYQYKIVSYELLQYLKPNLYGTIIIDEAHNFSGRFTKRGSALREICAMAERRLALTGTEIWSRPRDYWFLFSCLLGASFGSRHDFDLAYCAGKPGEYGGITNTGKSRLGELKFRVGFYRLRRTKAQVGSELPKLTRSVRWIDGTKRATALMRAAILSRKAGLYSKALLATLDDKMQGAIDAAVDARRFLLFTWTRRHAAFMHRTLVNDHDTPCYLIDGSVSAKKRDALISLAAKKRCGIVATIDTLKEGVDGLQHVASTGIMHALDFVPNKLKQAEKRLDRIGQTEPVQWIYILMKESMDVWVHDTVMSKLQAWDELTGEDDGMQGSLDPKKRRGAGQTEEELEKQIMKEIYLRAKNQ